MLLLALLLLQDPAAELRALLDEHRRDLRAWSESYRKADEDGREKLRATNPEKALVGRLATLASKTSNPAVLLELLHAADQVGRADAVREALGGLARDHAGDERLEGAIAPLQHSQDLDGLRGPLTALREKSPRPAVRAAAQFVLASMLLRSLDPTPEKKAEGRALFESLKKDHADTPYGRAAAGELFALENLQVGCTAPDFEAVDAEGAKFRLSDYRGKVVLLSFWGFW